MREGHKMEQTWKKSKLKPMFWNIDGSSELSATGTPWFIKMGRGCIGIDAASLYSSLMQSAQPTYKGGGG
jgi:hypothetical protein